MTRLSMAGHGGLRPAVLLLLMLLAVPVLMGCGPAPGPSPDARSTDNARDERSVTAKGAGPESAGQDGEDAGEASTSDRQRAAVAAARSGFDYFVLALSWSPGFCAEPGNAERSPAQCAAERPYALVVHGLWPQYENGFPIDCPTDGEPSTELVTGMLDIMPSPRLVAHEWRRHGGCSGLGPEAYFAATRKAWNGVRVPEILRTVSTPRRSTTAGIEAAFRDANPGLGEDEITLQCRKGRFQGVRLCLDKDFAPRSCGADVRETCPDGPVTIAALRGAAPAPKGGSSSGTRP